jgi:tRNA 2-(methylsulfanyl)-N6-isopentenyladenosine37 hydroxylase
VGGARGGEPARVPGRSRGLSLAGYYPDDAELVEHAAALAAEEVQHFRRVVAILRKRGWPLGGRRKNPWAQSLRARIVPGREPWTKVDRLLFGAMIEARSCERFTRLLEVIEDREVAHLLADLGPAERRHWQLFYQLAGRETDAETLAARFQHWREFEADLARGLGTSPAVHG